MLGKVYSYKTKNKGKLWAFIHDAYFNGKRKQIRKTGYKSAEEANDALQASRKACKDGKIELNSELTFTDVYNYYIRYGENEGRLAKGTLENYKSTYMNHLIMFHGVSVKKITKVFICEWERDLYNKGASLYTYNACVKLAKRAFNYVIEELDLISVNPFSKCKLKTPPKKIRHRFSTDEIREIIETCKEELPEYFCIFILSVLTGMRLGEYSALKTTDINPFVRKIEITKQITHGEYKDRPKTRDSVRCVNLSNKVKQIIQWHIETFNIKSGDFLFRADNGGPLYAKWAERKKEKLMMLCGYDPRIMRVHDLRGQYVDLMHFLNISTEYISREVGHSNSVITSNSYSQILKELPIEANDNLDELIFGKHKP